MSDPEKPTPQRICVIGYPKTGKTTVVAPSFGLPIRSTDSLIQSHDWSAASDEVLTWLAEPGPWVIEGVAAVRALRKWVAANAGNMQKPCDMVVWLDQPLIPLSKGQLTMAKGCRTIWTELLPYLRLRGVSIMKGVPR